MQTDTGCAKLCLTDWKIQATLPVSLRYATGYFMISYGLLWLTLQKLTAGEGVQSSANVTLTNRVREKYPNLHKTHFTQSVHSGVQTAVTLSEMGSYRMQSNFTLQPSHSTSLAILVCHVSCVCIFVWVLIAFVSILVSYVHDISIRGDREWSTDNFLLYKWYVIISRQKVFGVQTRWAATR